MHSRWVPVRGFRQPTPPAAELVSLWAFSATQPGLHTVLSIGPANWSRVGARERSAALASLRDRSPGQHRFVIVLRAASANHLSEAAKERLSLSGCACATYVELLRSLHTVPRPNGVLDVTDASPCNIHARRGVRSSFVPTVVRTRHQAPAVWEARSMPAGSVDAGGMQVPPNRGNRYRPLFLSRDAAYLTMGAFTLSATRAA
jgi:hypothetical protein